MNSNKKQKQTKEQQSQQPVVSTTNIQQVIHHTWCTITLCTSLSHWIRTTFNVYY